MRRQKETRARETGAEREVMRAVESRLKSTSEQRNASEGIRADAERREAEEEKRVPLLGSAATRGRSPDSVVFRVQRVVSEVHGPCLGEVSTLR